MGNQFDGFLDTDDGVAYSFQSGTQYYQRSDKFIIEGIRNGALVRIDVTAAASDGHAGNNPRRPLWINPRIAYNRASAAMNVESASHDNNLNFVGAYRLGGGWREIDWNNNPYTKY